VGGLGMGLGSMGMGGMGSLTALWWKARMRLARLTIHWGGWSEKVDSCREDQ